MDPSAPLTNVPAGYAVRDIKFAKVETFLRSKNDEFDYTRSSSRYAALLLGPCGAGTLASRAGGLRPPWVAFGHIGAPYGRHRSHMHASPALVDLSSATIQRRAWLGKVAKNAGKRPAVAAMVDLSSPPIQRRASSDRV